MRIDILFHDRVGIAHDVLAVLAKRGLNVFAMEVEPPHIYIDIPELTEAMLPSLRDDCSAIADVQSVQVLALLPGARRRLHLDAVMAVLEDPVLAIDGEGQILVANAAAATVLGISENELCQRKLQDLLADPALLDELQRQAYRVPSREIVLKGQPFMLDVTPLASSTQGHAVGAVLTLHTPRRIGGRIHALQHVDNNGFDAIIGESEPIKALKLRAARVAAVDAPLLITGETGTGKELLAQACHATSARQHAPFLELNCAALPESLAESELFGYTAGAFTGARHGGKPGLIEMADGGTVFLDEIGEMSLYLQAKLLRFLNDGKFRRIGGDKEIKVNVRIISATHRDLARMVQDGAFREDLYYRLNVLQLDMPPLRERGDDILRLARHFIERACTQAQKPVCRLNTAATSALLGHRWPGNVRQLQNVMFRAITLSDQKILDAADLGFAEAANPTLTAEIESWDNAIDCFEKQLLQKLYPQFPSSRKLATRLATSHSKIAAKLRKHGIPGRQR